MTDTKSEQTGGPWVHCGSKWTTRHCGDCGERRPAPVPEMTEDERMAWKLANAHACIQQGISADSVALGWWDRQSGPAKRAMLDFLACARELLSIPASSKAAEEAARAEGRREAYETVWRKTLHMDDHGLSNWMVEQRDACVPAKAAEAPAVLIPEALVGKMPQLERRLCDRCGPEACMIAACADTESLRAEVERLKAQVQNGYAACQGVANLREQLAGMTEQRDDLRAKLDQAGDVTKLWNVLVDECGCNQITHEGVAAEAIRVVRDLRADLQAMRLSLSEAADGNADLRAKLAEAERLVSTLRADLTDEIEEAKRLTRELEEARKVATIPTAEKLAKAIATNIHGYTTAMSAAYDAVEYLKANAAQAPAQPAPGTTGEPVTIGDLMPKLEEMALGYLSPSRFDDVMRAARKDLEALGALDQAAAVKAATEALTDKLAVSEHRLQSARDTVATYSRERDRLQSEVHRLAAKCDGLVVERDVAAGREKELEEKLLSADARIVDLETLRKDCLDALDGEMGSDADGGSIVSACVEWKDSVRILPEGAIDPEFDTLDNVLAKLVAARDANAQAARELEEARQVIRSAKYWLDSAPQVGANFAVKTAGDMLKNAIFAMKDDGHLYQPAAKPEADGDVTAGATGTTRDLPECTCTDEFRADCPAIRKPGDGKGEG